MTEQITLHDGFKNIFSHSDGEYQAAVISMLHYCEKVFNKPSNRSPDVKWSDMILTKLPGQQVYDKFGEHYIIRDLKDMNWIKASYVDFDRDCELLKWMPADDSTHFLGWNRYAIKFNKGPDTRGGEFWQLITPSWEMKFRIRRTTDPAKSWNDYETDAHFGGQPQARAYNVFVKGDIDKFYNDALLYALTL